MKGTLLCSVHLLTFGNEGGKTFGKSPFKDLVLNRKGVWQFMTRSKKSAYVQELVMGSRANARFHFRASLKKDLRAGNIFCCELRL